MRTRDFLKRLATRWCCCGRNPPVRTTVHQKEPLIIIYWRYRMGITAVPVNISPYIRSFIIFVILYGRGSALCLPSQGDHKGAPYVVVWEPERRNACACPVRATTRARRMWWCGNRSGVMLVPAQSGRPQGHAVCGGVGTGAA